MAMKRLQKEWQAWGGAEDEKMGQLNAPLLEGERPHWTVTRCNDLFRWDAELCVSQGPLVGARLVFRLHFPRDYPFNPPKTRAVARFVGFPVDWEEIDVGWETFLIPIASPDGERVSGRVTRKTDQEIGVCFVDGVDEGDERPHGPEQMVDKEWWEFQQPVLARSPQAEIFHPLLNARGGICGCGIRDDWHPCMMFVHCLAFLRVAVEDPDPEGGRKPVPRSSADKEMCFCTLDEATSAEYRRDPWAWRLKARRLFFQDRGVAPLCIRAEARDGHLHCVVSNLAGQELLLTEVDADSPFKALDRQIQESVPLVEGIFAWKVVLPDGTCADDVPPSATVREVLKL